MKRLFLITCILGACFFVFAGTVWAAPVLYNGHYYELTGAKGTWEWCEGQAVSKGGHLVTINDAAEEGWLRSQFGTGYLWIGFTDKASEGTWVWASGQPVTYTNWNGGEPNNAGNEDYAVMNWSGSRWNDWGGSNNVYGVIETAPVPLPAGLLLFAPGLLGIAAIRRKFWHP